MNRELAKFVFEIQRNGICTFFNLLYILYITAISIVLYISSQNKIVGKGKEIEHIPRGFEDHFSE